MDIFPAHIRALENGETQIQTVEDHNRNTAAIAGNCLASIGMHDAAYLAGLLHDMGKYTQAFSDYLYASARGEAVKRGSVIHTFQCCRLLLEKHSAIPEDYTDITYELLAYAASAHHGLYDLYSPYSRDPSHSRSSLPNETPHGFRDRIRREDIQFTQAKDALLHIYPDPEALCQLLRKADDCLRPAVQTLERITTELPRPNPEGEFPFYLGLLARLLLSSVIEGDRRDTASFMTGIKYPEPPNDLQSFWRDRLTFMERKLDLFAQDQPIQHARRVISDQCRQRSANPSGVYRLHVPTGSGKTLSSLRFALAHAAAFGKRRIIFTAPLLTILEQNAAILRAYIGMDDAVLEHHSNVFHGEDVHTDELSRQELLEENWDSPVVITTQVQFLNTLFAGKTSCIRRLWSLCDSVVVLDEVQTIPTHMLTLFNLAVNFLSEVCRTTFVLCSATQPCLEKADHPLLTIPPDIVPYDASLWQVFRRTQIRPKGEMTPDAIIAFCEDVLDKADSLLIVCNKRSEAETLFRALSLRHRCFHLSASMCPAHRRKTLELLDEALSRSRNCGEKTVCVSTQVIEAGVDISFQCVIRMTAGLDSIVQSAGRCNRNGESDSPSPVYVITWSGEKLGKLPTIQSAKNAAISLLKEYSKTPERFHGSLAGDEATAFYYNSLYVNLAKNYQDYCVTDPVIKTSLFDLLADNLFCQKGDMETEQFFLCQSFQTAGKLFQVFDADSQSVIVPYGNGTDLIAELASKADAADLAFLQNWLQRAKPYMVSIYDYETEKYVKGGMYAIAGIRILCPEQYDASVGLGENANQFLEV